MSDIAEKIKKYVIESGVEQSEIDSIDYIEDEILDSMQIVDLVTSFEDGFGITIDPDDIVPENFRNIDSMVQMVSGYIAKHESANVGVKNEKSNLETLWDMTARNAGEDDAISQSGWISSFTGKPFSEKEMQEYVDDISTKIRPFINRDSKVLEIGIGSGLVAKEIAPVVRSYTGIDISEETLRKTEHNMQRWNIQNVELKHGDMVNIADLNLGQYDVIMANSVVYYLNNVQEYDAFIAECLNHVNNGVVFIGDVMNADKRADYQKALKENNKKEHNKLLWYTRNDLIDAVKEMRGVTAEVSAKVAWTIPNEMNHYRFDVTYRKRI